MSEYKGQHTEQQIEKDPNPVKSWNLRLPESQNCVYHVDSCWTLCQKGKEMEEKCYGKGAGGKCQMSWNSGVVKWFLLKAQHTVLPYVHHFIICPVLLWQFVHTLHQQFWFKSRKTKMRFKLS